MIIALKVLAMAPVVLRKYRAQASIEFIIILAIMLAIFLSFFTAIETKRNNFRNAEEKLEAKTTAQKLGTKINEVHLAGDNSSSEVNIILKNNTELNVISEGPFVEIIYNEGRYIFPLLTDRVQDKQIKEGTVKIRNRGGDIVFS